jgi:quercetin dioxygenase-like cupin family protein
MNAKEYVDAVAAGQYPQDPTVPRETAFEDERGAIANLSLLDIGAVSEIVSRRGAVRANHWHKEDWHFAYVVAGKVRYFQRAQGDGDIPEPKEYGPGDLFFTPPQLEHAMLFTENSVILTWSKRRRDHDSHESDVVRVDFVTPAVAEKYL